MILNSGGKRFPGFLSAAALITISIVTVFASSILGDSAGAKSATNIRNPGDLSISLNGETAIQQECGNSFDDPGATAINSQGKFFPVKVSGNVESGTLGTYILVYTAVGDKDSVSIERTITVVDTTPPKILLEGGNPTTLTCGGVYAEPGVSAVDSCQGSIAVTTSGEVDSNVPGTYVISYTATDANNNSSTVTRKVIVGSTEENPPTIMLVGDAEMTVECGATFIDPGVTVRTACSGAVPVTTLGIVDVNTVGDYTITYSALSDELRADVPRTISVVDTTPPVISLQGPNTMTIPRRSAFTDPGATARDACAGEFAAMASGNVNPNRVGSYTITYTAIDPSGNQATPIKRTVNVIDARPSPTSQKSPTAIDR